ncbi:hypothetical protein ABTE40_20870, partial [Acinetobacter baumannii]
SQRRAPSSANDLAPLDKQLFDEIHTFRSSDPNAHLAEVRKLIDQGANVNAVEREGGRSVLMDHLSFWGDSYINDSVLLVTKLLLERG